MRRATCVIVAMLCTTAAAFAEDPEQLKQIQQLGRQVFDHEWVAGAPLNQGGDGLGPVFNDRSCVACHSQGGSGGAGPLEKNVDVLVTQSSMNLGQLRRSRGALANVHPALVQGNRLMASTLLHKYSIDPSYESWRKRLGGRPLLESLEGQERSDARRRFPLQTKHTVPGAIDGVNLEVVQRNTSALFGTGVIDQIPDRELMTIAKNQSRSSSGVSGRISPTDHGIGKFGWRAQTASLQKFILDACANEVGLEVPERDQANDPFRRAYRPSGEDLSVEQLRALVVYVSTLPPPERHLPADDAGLERVKLGQVVFNKTGCAECHVQTVGPAKNVFSDFLLHHMGDGLRDPATPTPESPNFNPRRASRRGGSGGRSSYGSVLGRPPTSLANGKGEEQLRILEAEWRTPPLWGIRLSAPYMHDGRATTLLESIAYHGGEAQKSMEEFFQLPLKDRMALLSFLESL